MEAGQISDDTEMALSLARSLVVCSEFDVVDIACSYVYWMTTGPLCAGATTKRALILDQGMI